MDLWKKMTQPQANKLSYPSMQLVANRLYNGNEFQAVARPSLAGYQDPMSLARINLCPIAQTTANLSRHTNTLHNVSILNLIAENNYLKTRLQTLAPIKQELLKNEDRFVQEPKRVLKEENSHSAQDTSPPIKNKQKSVNKKKYRRLANQIERANYCPDKTCSKSYGSEGSLHQHIRLKHPDFDILTWIRDKIKSEEAARAKEKEVRAVRETCKREDIADGSKK